MAENVNIPMDDATLTEIIRSGLISRFESTGAKVADPKNAFTTEIQKIKEALSKLPKPVTTDSLKLVLNETMLDSISSLSPSTASSVLNYNIATEILRDIRIERYLLHSEARYEDKTGPEIQALLSVLINGAKSSGKSLTQYRKQLESEKRAFEKRLQRTEARINKISSFDETNEADQEKILQFLKNPKLQELSHKEHISLKKGEKGAPKVVGEQTESSIVGYTPQEIQLLNRAFSNNDSSQLMTHEEDVKTGGVPTGRKKDVILWSRARFAFERALGNKDTKLYQSRKKTYDDYVALNKQMVILLREQIINLQSIMNVGIEKMRVSESFINAASEHFHSKPAELNLSRISNLINLYDNNLHLSGEEIMRNMEEKQIFDEQIKEVEKEMQTLIEKQSSPPKHVGEEAENFDPDYVYNLWRKDKGVHDAGGQRQGSKMSPSDWNISSTPGKFEDPMEGEQKTWELGRSLYSNFDPPSKKTSQDIRTLLTYRNDNTKITQPVEVGPYAQDEVLQSLKSKIEKLPQRGWGENLKQRVASSTNAHWSLLWNLGKQNITQDDFLSILGLSNENVISLADGTKKGMQEIFRQWPAVNSKSVRDQVVANPSTPDWILMYMAQHENDEQINAKEALYKRGWKVKEDEQKNPVISSKDGGWVWIKVKSNKKASLGFSFREAIDVTNPIQPKTPQQIAEEQRLQQINPQKPNEAVQPIGPPVGQQKVQNAPDTSVSKRPELDAPDKIDKPKVNAIPIADAKNRASDNNKTKLSWRG